MIDLAGPEAVYAADAQITAVTELIVTADANKVLNLIGN